ncbi:cytochrome P450 [Kitasatospora sp. GAS204A]|uniref:cytochrome P450 n=1 Tax=unclassified Kitasatospora TaxID=2633591 RepID=UPI0024764FDE|nr:cytochrome P450 [Kitasatospora sp. GAS204B]MDH6116139.1 cytochrome P450 [Kitasatospora sp. GAS204B]
MPDAPAAVGDEVRLCPFDFAEALDFDPSLASLLAAGPVTRIRLPYGADAWLVTGYEQVRTVTTDPRFSRAVADLDYPRLTPEPIVQPEAINVLDPPASTRLRGLIAKGFTPRQVERMRARTQRAVDELLDAMAEQRAPADLMAGLALPLPLTTICELLDIPEPDRPELRAQAWAMMDTGAAGRERAVQAKSALRGYFAALTAERRRQPGDDLISTLTTARDGGEALTDQELAVTAMILLVTGQDTTTYQIGNIAYTLLTRPALLAELRARPELLPRALDELLRLIPFRKGVGIPRVVTEDLTLGGVAIRAGEFVHVSYLTANRDPAKFDRPDELDLRRPAQPHMTFGWGAHHCLGAPLAVLELQVAIGSLLAHFAELRLAVPAERVRWNTGSIWRFPLELPVAW